jgi:hypothetical protein
MSEYICHQVSNEEFAIISNLLSMCPNANIILSNNHCLDTQGCLQGFFAEYASDTPISRLPVNRNMFYGTSMYEVDIQASALKNNVVYEDESDDTFVLQILMSTTSILERLKHFMSSIDHRSPSGAAADLDCVPDYANVNQDDCVDAKSWSPEQPVFAGLYHAYVKSFHKQCRIHKLFIVVNGGCQKVCDQFFNLCCDLESDMCAKEVYDSDEVWWIKRACSRARGVLATQIADMLSLVVKTSLDTFNKSHIPMEVAVATTETIYNDLQYDSKRNTVTLYNHCCNTTKSKNGILCCMHPSEGVWLFRGPPQTNHGFAIYGNHWGDVHCKVPFPTNTFRVHQVSVLFLKCVQRLQMHALCGFRKIQSCGVYFSEDRCHEKCLLKQVFF